MFQPPETFAQLRSLMWAAPLTCTFFVTAAAWGLGMGPMAWGLGLAAAAVSGLLAMGAVWASSYGVRHSLLTALSLFLTLSLPLSVVLVPAVAPITVHGWGPVALAAGAQGLLWVVASVYHSRRAQVTPGATRVTWPDCQVNLARRTIAKVEAEAPVSGRWISPSLVGAASVALYHVLKANFSADVVVVLGLVMANAMAVWLTTGPVARACGQAFQLGRIERTDGRPFVSARLPWLEQERARSPIGRWVRRLMPPRA